MAYFWPDYSIKFAGFGGFFCDVVRSMPDYGADLQDVKEFYQEDLSIIKIDVDKTPKIASIYKVSGVPTFVLFKNGQQIWRQSGMIPKMELHKLIDQAK